MAPLLNYGASKSTPASRRTYGQKGATGFISREEQTVWSKLISKPASNNPRDMSVRTKPRESDLPSTFKMVEQPRPAKSTRKRKEASRSTPRRKIAVARDVEPLQKRVKSHHHDGGETIEYWMSTEPSAQPDRPSLPGEDDVVGTHVDEDFLQSSAAVTRRSQRKRKPTEKALLNHQTPVLRQKPAPAPVPQRRSRAGRKPPADINNCLRPVTIGQKKDPLRAAKGLTQSTTHETSGLVVGNVDSNADLFKPLSLEANAICSKGTATEKQVSDFAIPMESNTEGQSRSFAAQEAILPCITAASTLDALHLDKPSTSSPFGSPRILIEDILRMLQNNSTHRTLAVTDDMEKPPPVAPFQPSGAANGRRNSSIVAPAGPNPKSRFSSKKNAKLVTNSPRTPPTRQRTIRFWKDLETSPQPPVSTRAMVVGNEDLQEPAASDANHESTVPCASFNSSDEPSSYHSLDDSRHSGIARIRQSSALLPHPRTSAGSERMNPAAWMVSTHHDSEVFNSSPPLEPQNVSEPHTYNTEQDSGYLRLARKKLQQKNLIAEPLKSDLPSRLVSNGSLPSGFRTAIYTKVLDLHPRGRDQRERGWHTEFPSSAIAMPSGVSRSAICKTILDLGAQEHNQAAGVRAAKSHALEKKKSGMYMESQQTGHIVSYGKSQGILKISID
jgi:hypothetical protein